VEVVDAVSLKSFWAQCGDEKIRTIWTSGTYHVKLDVCVPNSWNPNKMSQAIYEKTKFVIAETHKMAGKIPPISCRPHPKKRRRLQIIDGFHRWKIHQELGISEINVDVLYVNTERAMSMTGELNYDRGEPDMEEYPQYLALMMKEHDVDEAYLAKRLPESEDEIRAIVESGDFDIEEIKVPLEDDDDDGRLSSTKDASNMDALLEFKFMVRQGAAEVVEKELSRLGKALGGGKNIRGRALEMMAVLSSQTPSGSLNIASEGDNESGESRRKKHKRKKSEDE
jgi:ParB-like chromosome segregation protein Spo0J